MIKFEIKQEDLSNLGYPMDMMKEMYLEYHKWIKEGKSLKDFHCTLERSLEYCEKFIKDTNWLI
jgi:hypothetical protein